MLQKGNRQTDPRKDEKLILRIGSHRVGITHPSKILWPEDMISKEMLVDYYQSASSFILPFLKNRPISLLRHPMGIAEKAFYQKDAGKEAPSWVKTFPVQSLSSEKIISYILCNSSATLAYVNNLDCIELNPWHSVIRKPDYPDYLVLDLDPSDQNDFIQVMEVAHVFHALMQEHGVDCYCKTSGATGLHLFIPLGRKFDYAFVRSLAYDICLFLHEQLPGLTTMERSLQKRKSRIYLDHLQNSKGQTIVSVFSVRPRTGAPVSMPVDWSELKQGFVPAVFTIRNAATEIPQRAEWFKAVIGKSASLARLLTMMRKSKIIPDAANRR